MDKNKFGTDGISKNTVPIPKPPYFNFMHPKI